MLDSLLDLYAQHKDVILPAAGVAGLLAGRCLLWAGGAAGRAFVRGVSWALTPAEPAPLAEEVEALVEQIAKGRLASQFDRQDTIETAPKKYVRGDTVLVRRDSGGLADVSDHYTKAERRAIRAAFDARMKALKAEERERVRFAVATGEAV